MAVVTNTFQSTSAVGNREELSDVVSMISPEDTPIYSSIPKTKAMSTSPEWETDALAAPAANIQLEGDEYSFSAVSPPSRLKNHTQILRKGWIISATQDAVSNAGKQEQTKRQKLKAGIELRKDIEYAILDNNASVAGATRELGGLPSWYETNALRGTSGADGGYSSGSGLTVAATNGTQRAFTKALLDSAMQSVYNAGGEVRTAFVSTYVKTVFTGFMSDSNVAQFRYAVGQGDKNTIVATADVYQGDFGKVMVVPNRVQSGAAGLARNVHLHSQGFLEMKMLRPIQNDNNIAKTGDATKGVIIAEGTLCVKNEAALGVVADVFGLTSAS